eukprot:TRINITY_DN7785_c0_g1_i1.p2 TRINITY_DN7785_c0_g1~~TRINITY_DN7785_c0_g1_i1.p2  ORF type:complete len:308 (-),score=103.83 TRINITY_DN7785_c0_g1_i1:364-1287(-)
MPFASENVTIIDANEEHDEHGDKFIVYVVEIAFQGRRWRCRKRYTDFEKLYRKLVSVYGEKQVPHLTGKKKNPLGQFSADFVQKRKRKLQVFVGEVVDAIGGWQLAQSDKAIAGPGLEMGVNPFLYIFFEFERNMRNSSNLGTVGGINAALEQQQQQQRQQPQPQPALDSYSASTSQSAFFSVTPPNGSASAIATTSPALKAKKTPTLLPDEFAQFLHKLDALPDDEGRLKTAEQLLGSREGLTVDCLQAKAVVQRLFFSDSKLEVGRTLAPFIIDMENRQLVLDCIDFDEDEEELNREFDNWAEVE